MPVHEPTKMRMEAGMSESHPVDDRLDVFAQMNYQAARFGTKEQRLASEYALFDVLVKRTGWISDIDFMGIYLADMKSPLDIRLRKCNLAAACLSNLVMDNSRFQHCHFDGASLDGMHGSGCYFEDCEFGMAIMDRNVFDGARFYGCDMTRISFYSYPSLRGAFMDGSLVSPIFLSYLRSLKGQDRPETFPSAKSVGSDRDSSHFPDAGVA
jgi:uncharacterized protein YjbI with pentapeptide repeats